MYIPYRSFHQRHTVKNYVWGELKCYVRNNTEEKKFKKLKTQFFLSLRNCGFKKYVLTKLFQNIKTCPLFNKMGYVYYWPFLYGQERVYKNMPVVHYKVKFIFMPCFYKAILGHIKTWHWFNTIGNLY